MSPPPSAVLRQFIRLEQRRAGAGHRLGHQATRDDQRSLASASSRHPPRRATQVNHPATNTGPEPCCERQEYHETPRALAARPIRPANSLRHEQVSSNEHDAEANHATVGTTHRLPVVFPRVKQLPKSRSTGQGHSRTDRRIVRSSAGLSRNFRALDQDSSQTLRASFDKPWCLMQADGEEKLLAALAEGTRAAGALRRALALRQPTPRACARPTRPNR